MAKKLNDRLNDRLQKAIKTKNLEATKGLLRDGADGNIIKDEKSEFLINSVIGGAPEMVEWLIQKGAPLNQKDQMGRTPLHYARDAKMAEILINAGADVKAMDSNRKTPSQLASDRARPEVADVIKGKENELQQQNNGVDTNDLKPKGLFERFANPLNINKLKKVSPATKVSIKDTAKQGKKKSNGRGMR